MANSKLILCNTSLKPTTKQVKETSLTPGFIDYLNGKNKQQFIMINTQIDCSKQVHLHSWDVAGRGALNNLNLGNDIQLSFAVNS